MSIKDYFIVCLLAVFFLDIAMSFYTNRFYLPSKIIPVVKIIPDTYVDSAGCLVEIKSGISFVESCAGQNFSGYYEKEEKGNVVKLKYADGTTKEMCLFYGSDRMVPKTESCLCGLWDAFKKDCTDDFYFRRGSLPQSLLND